MVKNKSSDPNSTGYATRSSNKLVETMENFTAAVKGKQQDTSSDNDDYFDTSKSNSPSSHDLLINLSTELKLMRKDVNEIRTDVKSIKEKLDAQNDRINALENFVDGATADKANQQKMNLAFINKFESNEAQIKRKQAVFTMDCIDTRNNDYREKVRNFFLSAGAGNEILALVDISKFGTQDNDNGTKANTVLLDFPTFNTKLEFYKLIKTWKAEQEGRPKVYFNDFLTQKKLKLFKSLRKLKKEEKLYDVFTFRDNVFIKIKEKSDKPKLISSQDDIEKLKLE